MNETETILSLQDLCVQYASGNDVVHAVNGVSLDLHKGEALGLVGETGAGKTTTALSILRLIPDPPGRITSGGIRFEGEDLLAASESRMRKIRGSRISMIFQDPMTALNPVLTVGDQIAEVIKLHTRLSRIEVQQEAVRMLEMVGIPGERYDEYPDRFSGGMKQRVVIAIALACRPHLLIADEPTTALDVTIQEQVLDLIVDLKKRLGTSLLLITHDLGVVAEVCDKAAIMYAGRIVEYGNLEQIYDHPLHPYTRGLFRSIPTVDRKVHRLQPIPGLMPDPANLPPGCPFAPRCPHASAACRAGVVPQVDVGEGHLVACLKAGEGGSDA